MAVYLYPLPEGRNPMRMVAFVTLLAVLVGAGCPGKAAMQSSAVTGTVKWPTEATSTLTEDELVQLVKALPALRVALKTAKWWFPAHKEGDEDRIGNLVAMVESMNLPAVVESLAARGGWVKLRPTLYKVFAATAALVIDRTSPEFIARLKEDTTAAGKRTLANYEFFRTACTQIPETNKQLVAEYQEQLQPLGSLGR
jgi:hypothetical protein